MKDLILSFCKYSLISTMAIFLLPVTSAKLLAQNGSWTIKTDMPSKRAALSASMGEGKVYVLGGFLNDTPWGGPASKELEIYDPATDSWDTTKANMPGGRNSLASVVVNGQIYALGGQSQAGTTAESSVMIYDPQNNIWDTTTTEMPEPRSGLSAAVVNDKIYVIGGWNFSGTKYKTAIWEYDPVNNSWDTTRAKMPTGRAYLATCVVNNKIYAFGGINNDASYDGLNTLEVYDLATNEWTQKADMPAARIYCEAEAVDGLIYIFGGSDNPNNLPSSNVWEYNPVNDTYREMNSMPLSLMHAASAEVNGKIYNFGGLETAIAFPFIASSKVLEFTPPKTIHVPADQPTIQAAIDFSSDGDRVLVADGKYYENINFKGKAITVASEFIMDGDTSHISKTIIDGSQPSHPDTGSVVRFISGEDTTSVLCGFTITGGSGTQLIGFVGIAGYGGGGILLHSGGKIIHNKITDNHISTNQVAGGAGLLVSTVNSSNIIIEDNSITYNTSVTPTLAHGGGMVLRPRWNGGFIHVQNNFIGNNAVTCTGTYKANGAGIGVSLNLPTTGTIIIENNEITDNELHCIAAMGAGIYVVYYEPGGLITDTIPTPLIYNNIITNNFSQDKGAGIGIWTIQNNHDPNSVICPQPAIINNTIVGNRASDGCGIFNFDSDPLILNNILWNDLSVEGSREIFNDDIDYPEYSDKVNDGVIYAYYSDIQGSWEDEGNIDSDPLFADTINFYLTQQSPCIDAGYDNSFFNDLGSGGIAQWPAMGSLRNDLGTYGGPYEYDQAVLTDIIKIITNIQGNIQNMATNFHLSQNYPNPFNPSTTIEFTLSKFEFVELKVYNIIGKEVSTLVSNKLNQGNHTYTFDGKNLASGVYYYRIKAGNFVQTRKMIYLK
jgi:N-acetylneuraminic acid mutarotase